jgi:hypothetical protein
MEFVKEGYVYSDNMENGCLQGAGYSSISIECLSKALGVLHFGINLFLK